MESRTRKTLLQEIVELTEKINTSYEILMSVTDELTKLNTLDVCNDEKMTLKNHLKVEKFACTNCYDSFDIDELVCKRWMVWGEYSSVYVCPHCGDEDGLLFIKE